MILVDPNNPDEIREAEELNQRIMRRAMAFDGTCTGEHGVGRHKRDILGEELGDEAIALMKSIKRAWDPKNLLNPGKVVNIGR